MKTKKERLTFNTRQHKYTLRKSDGTKKVLQSVTEYISKFFPPFEAKKTAKMCAYWRTKKGDKTTMSDVLKEWKAVADLGTDIHKQLEDYINIGNKVLLKDERAKKIYEFYRDEIAKDINIGAECTEVRLYNEHLGLAGTIDLMIVDDEGSITLVDWKTNRSDIEKSYKKNTGIMKDLAGNSLSKYYIQLAMYRHMLEEKGHKVLDSYIIWCQPDREPKMYKVPDCQKIIKEMVENE